jgi:antitoxin CptB
MGSKIEIRRQRRYQARLGDFPVETMTLIDDPRRRRALFRSWHRGMRETDLLMGRFADAEIARLSETDLADYEALLEAQDRDILGWLTGELDIPASYDTPVLERLRRFHTHAGPIHV